MDRKIEKKTWTPKRIAIISGGALFVFFIAYQFLFGDNSTKLNVKSDKITIAKVTKGPFQEFIPVTGNVMPIKTIYLDAMEGGRVDKLFVEEGAMLKQGEEILKLTNTNLQMDVMFREAQLFEQINNLRNTRLSYEQTRLRNKSDLINLDYEIQKLKRTYDIQKGLQSQNLTTPQEFETARDEYDYAAKRRDLLLET
ncbi:MAG TPA: efflux RND transporter periplasmic adaptor subunit, partial [bacterium]|nr:efflux RND transporter periplasmic adaptor subunit [bacterium]